MAVMEKLIGIFKPSTVKDDAVSNSASGVYQLLHLGINQIDELLVLNLRCFSAGEHYERETFQYLLSSPDYMNYCVISDKNRMVGFILISILNQGIGHITTIGVSPDHRRRGIAKRMLQHAERVLKRQGYGSIVLEVRENNIAAQNLYRRNGYYSIQKLFSYYTNGENAFLMSKAL
ncbi:MAG: ribosomal protein S18-alanine N-acetyltransferase [Pyrinomonadaceae bacterium]